METIQDQKGITLFLCQLQWGKENAQDIRIVISQAQLDSGLTRPILEETKTWTPYIEEGLNRHIRIAIENVWCPTLKHEEDASIMQFLSRLPGVTKGELKRANLCRKWMKVITISELASIDCKYIPANCFNGQWRAKSNLRWPRQPAPTKGMWDIFRRLVKQALCLQYKHTPLKSNVHLYRVLGGWYQTTRHVQYDEYRTRIKFFQQQDNGFQRYAEKDNTNYLSEDGHCEALPAAAHPAESTRTIGNNLQAVHQYSVAELPTPPSDNLPEVNKTDIDYIHQATNI
jgi:hypothetical protein